MFFFFALGATGGVTALLTSDKPIFERYSSQRTQNFQDTIFLLKAKLAFCSFFDGFVVLMQ